MKIQVINKSKHALPEYATGQSAGMYSHKLAILFQTRLKCHIHLVQVLLMYMTTA